MTERRVRDEWPAAILLALFSVGLAVISLDVPLFADDYCRAHPDFDLSRAVGAAWNSYLDWSGRFPVMFLNNVLFSGDGTGVIVIAVLNGVASFAAGIMLLRWLGPGGALGNLCWMVFYLALFWFSTRSFGEVVFWKTGTVQFFWGAIAATACVGVMARATFCGATYAVERSRAVVCVLGGFLGGMWLEHVSVAVTVTGAGLLVAGRLAGGVSWPRVVTLVYGAWVAGTVALVAAPGNYARIDVVNRVDPIVSRVLGITSYLLLHLDALILLAVIAFLAVALVRRPADFTRRALMASTFLVAGVVAAYATLGAPVMVFTGRVAFTSQWFFIVAAMALFPATLFNAQRGRTLGRLRVAAVSIAVACGLALAFDGRNIHRAYASLAAQESARNERIDEALSRGETELQLPPLYFSKRLHTKGREVNQGRRFARDITIDSRHFTNLCYARYHGLDKVAL